MTTFSRPSHHPAAGSLRRFRHTGYFALLCGLLLLLSLVITSCTPTKDPGTIPSPGEDPGTDPGDNPGTDPGDDPGDIDDVNNPADLVAYCNAALNRLRTSWEKSDLLPSSSELLPEIVFSLERLSGSIEDFPDFLYYSNQMTLANLASDEGGLVRVIRRSYPTGTVTITSVDGAVQSVSTLPGDSSSFLPDDFSLPTSDMAAIWEALTLRETDLVTEKEAVYRLSEDALRRLLTTLGTEGEEAEAICDTVRITLDFSRYNQAREITFRLSAVDPETGNALSDVAVLVLDLSGMKDSRDSGTVRLQYRLQNPGTDDDALTGTASLTYTADRLELTADLSAGDLSLALHLQASQGDRPEMTGNLTVTSLGQELFYLDGTLTASDHNTLEGALLLRCHASSSDAEDGLLSVLPEDATISLTFSLTTDAENRLCSLSGKLTLSSPALCAEGTFQIDREAFRTAGALAAEFHLSLETDVSFTSLNLAVRTESTGRYVLSLTISGEEGTQSAEYRLVFPATAPELSPEEEEQLNAADRLYENTDHISEVCAELNQAAIAWVSSHPAPSTPCYTIRDGVYYFTFFTGQEDGTLLVTTSPVLPSASDLYLSSRYNASLSQRLPSPMEEDAERLENDFNQSIPAGYHRVYNDARVYASRYIPSIGQYLLVPVNGSGGQITLLPDNPAGWIVDGWYIHDADGATDVHRTTKSYDSGCHALLHCEDCGMEFRSDSPEHDGTSVAVPTEDDSRAEFTECARCHGMTLTLLRDSGTCVTVTLEKWSSSRADLPLEQDERDALLAGDPAQALCITGMTIRTPETLERTVIPSLTAATGYTIVAVRSDGMRSGNYGTLVLPEGIRYLLSGALRGYALTGVVLPESVVYIGSSIFSPYGIRELTIPAGVRYLIASFAGMRDLTSLTLYCRNIDILDYPSSGTPLNLTLAPGTRIGTLIGSSEYQVTTLIIPEGVESIEGFRDNPYLQKVVLPNSLTAIGDNAFSGCTALREVVVGRNLQAIGSDAFAFCSSLRSLRTVDDTEDDVLTLPASLTEIGGYAFRLCTSLRKVRIDAEISVIPNGLFDYCDALESVQLPDSVSVIGSTAFMHCAKLRLRLPAGLVSIGDHAFDGCTSLTDEDVVFGDSLEEIGECAFANCTGLRNLIFPASLTRLSNRSPFDGCTLETVIFRNPVTQDVSLGVPLPKKIVYEGPILARIQFASITEIRTTQLPEESPHFLHRISYPVTVYFAGTREVWDATRYDLTKDSVLICDYDFSSSSPAVSG